MLTFALKDNFKSKDILYKHVLHMFIYRGVELLLCYIGLVAMLVLTPLILLLNHLFAPGPLFYEQTRIGQYGRTFTIFKFRSMIVDAEVNGAVWAQANDERMTLIGQILRRTHIDELPQLLNIIRGDMSLIGPRPERPEFVKQLIKELPEYNLRHSVRPGLTGWAQVNYGYGASVDDAAVKLVYDLEYIRKQSWQMDLLILGRTIWVVIANLFKP